MHEHFRMRGYVGIFDRRLAYAGTADMQLVTVRCACLTTKTEHTCIPPIVPALRDVARVGQSCALGTQAIQQ